MAVKAPTRRRLESAGVLAALGAVMAASLFPVVWMFLTSVKTRTEAFAIPPVWLFRPTLANYQELFATAGFARSVINSLVISVISVVISVAMGSLAAYAFARFPMRGARLQFAILLFRILPPVALIVPLFILFSRLDLVNRYEAVILANLTFEIPMAVWMLTGFFRDLSPEFEDAALLDGCTRLGALFRIAYPLAGPGLAATSIICFLYAWNEYLYAVILTGIETKTVAVAAADAVTGHGVLWGQMAAAGSIAMLPTVVLATVTQRYLLRGLASARAAGRL